MKCPRCGRALRGARPLCGRCLKEEQRHGDGDAFAADALRAVADMLARGEANAVRDAEDARVRLRLAEGTPMAPFLAAYRKALIEQAIERLQSALATLGEARP